MLATMVYAIIMNIKVILKYIGVIRCRIPVKRLFYFHG
jgi:hypothetical protein